MANKMTTPHKKKPATPDTPAKSSTAATKAMDMMNQRILELTVERDNAFNDMYKSKSKIADLVAQVNEHAGKRYVTPEEDAALVQVRTDRDELMTQQNKIALWLRKNKAKEIEQGRHIGLQFHEVVIRYLVSSLDVITGDLHMECPSCKCSFVQGNVRQVKEIR